MTVQAIYKPAAREVLLVVPGTTAVLSETEAARTARAIDEALAVRSHAQSFREVSLQDDECPCPACRSDVVGIVPCMSAIQNPARAAAPTGRPSPGLSVGKARRSALLPQQP